MTDAYIHALIPGRMRELGFSRYHERLRDLTLEPGSIMRVDAYNELYFIVDDPPGVIVESDYGRYDSSDAPVGESIHQHRGEIIIRNPGTEKRRIKFIQVIMIS